MLTAIHTMSADGGSMRSSFCTHFGALLEHIRFMLGTAISAIMQQLYDYISYHIRNPLK